MSQQNSQKLFFFNGETVIGPLTPGEVAEMRNLGSMEKALVWDGASPQWMGYAQWLKAYAPAGQKAEPEWFYAFQGQRSEGQPLANIISGIKEGRIPLGAFFWTEGLPDWVGLGQLPHIVEGAGLLRRTVPRLPIQGTVEVLGFPHSPLPRLTTLSEKGFGLFQLLEFGQGAKINVRIHSDDLGEPLATKSEILYQKGESAGLVFRDLNESIKSHILKFIQNRIKAS